MSEAAATKIHRSNRVSWWLYLPLAVGLIILAGLFCFSSGIGPRHAHATFKRIQASIDPETLRKWAIEQSTKQSSHGYLKQHEIPKWILELEAYPPTASISRGGTNENLPYAVLMWGGGFFHWGMFIGPEDYQLQLNPEAFHDIEWVRGVYFRHEGAR